MAVFSGAVSSFCDIVCDRDVGTGLVVGRAVEVDVGESFL